MKNIIHMQIPYDDDNCPILDMETINNYYNHVNNIIGEEYHVIVTPFNLKCLTETESVIAIDCKTYTFQELNDIINKHNNG